MSEKQIGCRKKVLVLTAFDASFPDLDDLGEPFISVIRNRLQVLRHLDKYEGGFFCNPEFF